MKISLPRVSLAARDRMQPRVKLFKNERDSVERHITKRVSKVVLTRLDWMDPSVALCRIHNKSKPVATNQTAELFQCQNPMTGTKYGLRTKKKIHYNDLDSVVESQEALPGQKKMMTQLANFFKDNKISLKPRSPIIGDGNCFFRSIADQILLHKISNKPTSHQDLRIAVCDHIENLPAAVLDTIMNVVFNGKKRALSNLARRQRRLGSFVDNDGIMVLTTALYLGRHIHLYSNDSLHEFTAIDGGEGASQHPPITVFYFRDYQHYQSIEVKE